MKTEIMGAEGIEYAATLIKRGEIVAFPTETVYGLGADAFNAEAIAKIYAAKGRPSDNPLIVHISKLEDAARAADDLPDAFYALAKAFMPGPLTVVVRKKAAIPDCVTAGLNTVGIRMPAHPVAREFIAATGTLIAAPSANASTHVSPTAASHVYKDLQGRIPLIIDGGNCDVGIESTVLSIAGTVPTILRPGAITEEMLSGVLGQVKLFTGKVDKAPAPGMKYRHYAPTVEAYLANGVQETDKLYAKLTAQNKKTVIIAENGLQENYADKPFIGLGDGEIDVARHIYGAFRQAEEGFDALIIQKLSDNGVYASVMNRVEKATARPSGGKLSE